MFRNAIKEDFQLTKSLLSILIKTLKNSALKELRIFAK